MSSEVMVLSYELQFLNLTSFKKAVRLIYRGKAEVRHIGTKVMKTVWGEMEIPVIIRMLYSVARRKRKDGVQLTKKNVLLRDDYICQYCSKVVRDNMATVDHVIPKSAGGPASWENLVCCCVDCNQRKRNRTPQAAGMRLKAEPVKPKSIQFKRIRKHTKIGEWMNYIYLYGIDIDQVRY